MFLDDLKAIKEQMCAVEKASEEAAKEEDKFKRMQDEFEQYVNEHLS